MWLAIAAYLVIGLLIFLYFNWQDKAATGMSLLEYQVSIFDKTGVLLTASILWPLILLLRIIDARYFNTDKKGKQDVHKAKH